MLPAPMLAYGSGNKSSQAVDVGSTGSWNVRWDTCRPPSFLALCLPLPYANHQIPPRMHLPPFATAHSQSAVLRSSRVPPWATTNAYPGANVLHRYKHDAAQHEAPAGAGIAPAV